MIWIDDRIEDNASNQTICFGIAAAVHLALLLWNPALLRNTWRTITLPGDGGTIVIDMPGAESSAAGPVTQPKFTRPFLLQPTVKVPVTSKPYHLALSPRLPIHAEQFLSTFANSPILIATAQRDNTATTISHPPILLENKHAPLSQGFGVHEEGSSPSEGVHHLIIRTEATPEPPIVLANNHTGDPHDGPQIEGPLSNRKVIHRVIPSYPAWAEETGITGTTRLYFMVSSDGVVRPTIRVTFTSGYPELDRLAMEALRGWRFAPAHQSDKSQYGIITFFFSLARG